MNGNQGCSVAVDKSNSYGPSFNSRGGGIIAMERTNNFIRAWFWPRGDGSLPAEVSSGSQSINTDNWVRVCEVALVQMN